MSGVYQILSYSTIKSRQTDHQFGSDSEAGRDGTDVDTGIN